MKTLTTKELQKIRDERQSLPIINVLPRENYEKQHIAGSVSIPLEEQNFVQQVEGEAKSKSNPLVVYCASSECDASPKAAKKLEDAGFTRVYDYEPGTKGWKDAGLPVVGAT